jgi:hypothetical protein
MRFVAFVVIVVGLLFVGLGAASLRHFQLGVDFEPTLKPQAWAVELQATGDLDDDYARISLRLPSLPNVLKVTDQKFASSGYSLGIVRMKRSAIATLTNKSPTQGEQFFTYRVELERSEVEQKIDFSTDHQPGELSAETTDFLRKLLEMIQQTHPQEKRSRALVYALFDSDRRPEAFRTFPKELRNRAGRLAALSYLDVPYLMVRGVRLDKSTPNAALRTLLLVKLNGEVRVLDLSRQRIYHPRSYFLWGESDELIEDSRGLTNLEFSIALAPLDHTVQPIKIVPTDKVSRILAWFSLSRFPVHSQNLFRVLLLLPLAALVITFLRNVVGMKTFGTFLPALISLVFAIASI